MSDLHDLLTQEVDDEVRREKMLKRWKAYRKYVYGGAAAIILIVAGREIYQYQVKTHEEAQSTAFETAMSAADAKDADLVKVWQDALPGLDGTYHAMAQLRLAAAEAKKGDTDAALKAYDAVAGTEGLDVSLRDLAQLQAGMLLASNKDTLDKARGRLSLVAVKGKPWYYSALEQLTLIDIQKGDLKDAHTKAGLLADDTQTPQAIRARADQLRGYIEDRQKAEAPAAEAAPAAPAAKSDSPDNASKEKAQ